MTTLMRACEGGHLPAVIELVENRGANVNAKDNVRCYIHMIHDGSMDRCEFSPHTYESI